MDQKKTHCPLFVLQPWKAQVRKWEEIGPSAENESSKCWNYPYLENLQTHSKTIFDSWIGLLIWMTKAKGQNSRSPKKMGIPYCSKAEHGCSVHISHPLKQRNLNMMPLMQNKNDSPLPLKNLNFHPLNLGEWTKCEQKHLHPKSHLITEASRPRCGQRGWRFHGQAPAGRSQFDAEDMAASLEEELKRHFTGAHAWSQVTVGFSWLVVKLVVKDLASKASIWIIT